MTIGKFISSLKEAAREEGFAINNTDLLNIDLRHDYAIVTVAARNDDDVTKLYIDWRIKEE